MNKRYMTLFGVLVIAIISIPFEFISINLGGFSMKLYQIIVLIISVILYMFFIIKRYKYKLPLLSMLFITIVSCIYSINFIPIKYVAEGGVQLILYICLTICVVIIVTSKSRLNDILSLYYYSGIIISVYSLIEFIGVRYLHLPFFKIWTGSRSDAFFKEANWLSAYSMTILFLSMHYCYKNKTKRNIMLVFINLIPLLLSQSRGAYIAIILSMIILSFSRNKEIKSYFKLKNILMLILALVFVLIIMNDAILDIVMRSSSNSDLSTSQFRFNMLIRGFNELPPTNFLKVLFGQGLGMLKWYKGGILVNSAWNMFIAFYIENGLVFFMIFASMSISILHHLYRVINTDDICVPIALNYISMLIFACTSNLACMGYFWFSLGIAIACLNIYYKEKKNENKYNNSNL